MLTNLEQPLTNVIGNGFNFSLKNVQQDEFGNSHKIREVGILGGTLGTFWQQKVQTHYILMVICLKQTANYAQTR